MATGLFNLKQVNQAISQGAWSGYIAPKWVEYLVVAGGAAGGAVAGGGGGAGGLLTGIVSVASGTSYTVTVGGGGAGVNTPYQSPVDGANGSNSVFGSVAATGGGGGGAYPNRAGKAGGSGGGAGQVLTAQGVAGLGTFGQGNDGVNSTTNYGSGGGGAGTRGAGIANGGAGIASSISGTVTTYAGGGGGGGDGGAGTGGVGGGGAGGLGGGATGASGGANTGGGGGGAGGTTATSGSGGSGIVVVRYPGSIQFFTGGTLSYANGYMIHTFYASGTLAPTTPTPYVTDYQISRSLRFNSADSAYLNRTPASATNQKTWTWSGWIKRGKLDVTQYTVFTATGGQGIRVNDDSPGNQIRVRVASLSLIFTPVLRDPSAWYHIVVSVDTTQATSSDRVKLYINNQLAPLSSGTYPSQNADTGVNAAVAHFIGAEPTPSQYYDGLMTEINFIDGQALTPSSFGYTNPATGVWSPLAFVGTYGTNGFYLNFSDNSNTTAATLGKDYSGNGNNWSPNNFSVTAGSGNDSLVDSPTSYGTDTGVGGTVRGNYATLNPLILGTTTTLANGNLDYSKTNTLAPAASFSTIGVTSGKWYAEYTVASNFFFGIWGNGNSSLLATAYPTYYWDVGASSGALAIEKSSGTSSGSGGTFAAGDIYGVAFDADAATCNFYKNNTLIFSVTGMVFSGPLFFTVGAWGGEAASGPNSVNFGQRPFAYTAPSGYKALCTQNLPTPAIGATSTTLATQYFNPVTYTGLGATQTVTVGFQPDFTWIKNRTLGANWHVLTDSVRGVQKEIYTNSTAAEATLTTSGVNQFNAGGFQILGNTNDYNGSTSNYVAWNWRASNATAVTNTAGSITSTVSANTTSGFSVVTWTCPSSGAGYTVGHGLGATPAMIIVKERSATNDWYVWHQSFASTTQGNLRLNTTAAVGTSSLIWNNTAPTSTVFSTYVGTTLAASGTGVAYCFAQIAGYSAFGSYTGNGSTDGPFVFTGFRPAYVMVKRTDTTDQWTVYDGARNSSNLTNRILYPNLSNAEDVGTDGIDMLSNGFKIRATYSNLNASGGTYIYMVFASAPFKYSLGR